MSWVFDVHNLVGPSQLYRPETGSNWVSTQTRAKLQPTPACQNPNCNLMKGVVQCHGAAVRL